MKTRNRVLVVAMIVVVGLAAAGIAWFLNRDSIDAVDIERALEEASVAGQQGGAGGEGDASTEGEEAGAITDATGSWVVDTDFVEFDEETGSGTWVGYRIDEELRGIGDYTAVGRSPRVEGGLVIDGSQVTSATFSADLQALVSDNANRDSRVRPLFADRPVVFTLSEPVDFGAVPSEGQRIAVSAAGVLRIGDIERDIEVELSADVAGPRLVVTGSTVVTLSDFDVSVPSAPIVLSVADDATIELQLFLSRG
jgi:hypothetical protein